jgi:uncharacterized protein YdhG (YjbR/CyaY superfamily)
MATKTATTSTKAANATKATKRTGEATRFTDEEIAAARERAKELKAQARRGPGADKGLGLKDVLDKIAEMPKPDRDMAERIHAVVLAAAPDLAPRTWYGMPAYARDGKVLCFFTPAAKFKERYATFGFNAEARLDEGSMWPTSWALTKLTPADEKRIAELVRKAVR